MSLLAAETEYRSRVKLFSITVTVTRRLINGGRVGTNGTGREASVHESTGQMEKRQIIGAENSGQKRFTVLKTRSFELGKKRRKPFYRQPNPSLTPRLVDNGRNISINSSVYTNGLV